MRACCCRSYQWDVQPTVLRIATSMRTRNFNVWMDTEMMSGSTLDAMAAAVEDAHCVLICITERYKARGCLRLRLGAGCVCPLRATHLHMGTVSTDSCRAHTGERELSPRGHV